MSDVSLSKCEYCGKENVPIYSTPERDSQCEECHQLTISNCKEEIKKFKKQNNIRYKKSLNEDIEELKRKKDEAIANLMNGDYTRLNK